MTTFLVCAAVFWVVGWVLTIMSTDVPQKTGWKKFGGVMLLLLVWPYIALVMASEGDI